MCSPSAGCSNTWPRFQRVHRPLASATPARSLVSTTDPNLFQKSSPDLRSGMRQSCCRPCFLPKCVADFVSRALFEHVWHAGLVTRLRTFLSLGFCEFARRAPHEPCAAVLIGNLLESRENVPSSAPSSLLTLIIMSCGRQVVHIDIIGKRCALLPPAHRPHTHTHCPCCRRPRKGQQEGLASTSFCMAVCMSSRTVHSPISTCMHIYKCVLARTRLFTCALRRVAHVLNC